MTISRKRMTGAAFAGSALVLGAVFTPVAAYAAPAETTPGETTPVETSTAVLEAVQSVYTTTESISGIEYVGAGFPAGAAFELYLLMPGATEPTLVPDVAGTESVVTEDGTISGAINFYEGDVAVAFDEGDYEIIVVLEDGTEYSAAVTVSDEPVETTPVETDDTTTTPAETEDTTTPPAETTEDTTGDETEEAAPIEQTLVVEQDTYTPAESVNGVNYAGSGFAPNTDFKLWVQTPGSTEWTEVTYTPSDETEPQVSDAEGNVSGSLNYYNLDTGVAIEFPEGAYQVRVTQVTEGGQELAAEASFTVGEVAETTPPTDDTDDAETIPTTDESEEIAESDDAAGSDDKKDDQASAVDNNTEDQLAQTGADDLLPVFVAGGLVLMAAGAGLFMVRRRLEA